MQNLQFNLIKFEQYIVYNKLSTYVSCKKNAYFLCFSSFWVVCIFPFLHFCLLLIFFSSPLTRDFVNSNPLKS